MNKISVFLSLLITFSTVINGIESIVGQDYYMALGIPRWASDDDIKKAWENEAQRWDPDKWFNVNDKKIAEENLKYVQIAHETLSDPARRSSYDKLNPNAGVLFPVYPRTSSSALAATAAEEVGAGAAAAVSTMLAGMDKASKKIDLRGKELKGLSQNILNELAKFSQLEELDLGNYVGPSGHFQMSNSFKTLPDLSFLPNLQILHLRALFLEDINPQHLPSSLKTLDLFTNPILKQKRKEIESKLPGVRIIWDFSF